MTRPKLELHTAGAVRSLASPIRLEIVEALQVGGAATVADLAERLGRSPDSLYHHLRRLAAAGIVVQEGRARGAGRSGAVYAAVAKSVVAPLDAGSDSAGREAWADVAGSLLRRTGRELRRAAAARDARTQGPDRNLALIRRKVRLDAAALRELNHHLESLDRWLAESPGPRGGRLFHLTYVLAPLELQDEEA